MYKFKTSFLLLILCMHIISCGTKKPVFDPNTTKTDYISFGTGGGFTGKVNRYYLSVSGDIFVASDSMFTKIANVSTEMTNQIFKNYTVLGLDKMILNDPGNKYYFIERNIGGEKQILTWGKNPLDNTNISTYFDILMKPVKDKNVK
jgi:hypothetical protein